MANTLITGTVQTLGDAWFAERIKGAPRDDATYMVVPIANAPRIREAMGRKRAADTGKDWPTRPDYVSPGKQGPPERRGVWWYVDFEVSRTGTEAAFRHDATVQGFIGKTQNTDGTAIPPKPTRAP